MKSKRILAVVAALAVVALLFAAAGYAYTASTTTTNNEITSSYLIVTPLEKDGQKTTDFAETLDASGIKLDTENTTAGVKYKISSDETPFYYDNGALTTDDSKTKIYKVGVQKVTIDKKNVTLTDNKIDIYFKAKSDTTATDGFTIYYSLSAAETPATNDKAGILCTGSSADSTALGATNVSFTGDTATMFVTFYVGIDEANPPTISGDGEVKLITGASFTYKASTNEITA